MVVSAAETEYWNNLPKQEYSVKEHGFGDCWRACVAAVLGLENKKLPLFNVDKEGITGDIISAETQKYLARIGFILIRGHGPNSIMYPKYTDEDRYHDVPIIAVGPTTETKSLHQYRHCCVYELATDHLLYDPTNIDRDPGLISIEEVYMIFSLYNIYSP